MKRRKPKAQTVVDVPEFGDGETVIVVNLAAYERELIAIWTRRGYQAMTVMAALSAYDDDGRLVFGKTKDDAIRRVAGLSMKRPLVIARIAKAALQMTAQAEPDARVPQLDDED